MRDDYPNLNALVTPATRPTPTLQKGPSRLQATKSQAQITVVNVRVFKREIWARDLGCCRKCGRKVIKTLARVPERGETHHLHGRTGDLRFEVKCALLACCSCHEQLTGRVNEKWIAVGTRFWTLNGERVIDARFPVHFKRVA